MRLNLTRRETRLLRQSARLLSVFASLFFLALTVSQGPPAPPEGPGLERDVQYVFVVIGVVATLIAWFSPATGGSLMFLAGLVLGIAASMRYSEGTALAVALLFVVPGALFLATWASRRPAQVQFGLALLVVVLMAYGGREANVRHARAVGPAHPQSALTITVFDKVEWVWSGGVTSNTAVENARVTEPGAAARVIATSPQGVNIASSYATADAQGVVSMKLVGLDAGTRYEYAVETGGQVDSLRTGELTTFTSGPASFRFAVAACARTGSNGAVFDTIRELDPLFYVIAGDMNYENITSNSLGAFRRAYETVLTSPAQQALYRETPIAYIWDDHDFGGNNSDGHSPAKAAAQSSYDTYVPHYGLVAGDGGIYQAFDVGRVRFILLDTRSYRNRELRPDGTKSLLGAKQLQWLKDELTSSSETHGLIVLVSAVPWIGDFSDSWGGFDEERAEIAQLIATRGIRNLVMLGGDAHMVALDDGTNTNYADEDAPGFPILHAGALDRPGSVKGGPYSEGAFAGAGQFGIVEITDDGQAIQARLTGHTWDDRVLVDFTFVPPAR